MRTISVLALVASLLAGTATQAQTLAQKQMMAQQDKLLAEELPATNKACGTSMTAAIDWPGFLASSAGSNSIYGYCAEALHSMAMMCSDTLSKDAIAAKIKSYSCSFGGPGKRAMSLAGDGKLGMAVDWDAANYDDYVKAWLGDHL